MYARQDCAVQEQCEEEAEDAEQDDVRRGAMVSMATEQYRLWKMFWTRVKEQGGMNGYFPHIDSLSIITRRNPYLLRKVHILRKPGQIVMTSALSLSVIDRFMNVFADARASSIELSVLAAPRAAIGRQMRLEVRIDWSTHTDLSYMRVWTMPFLLNGHTIWDCTNMPEEGTPEIEYIATRLDEALHDRQRAGPPRSQLDIDLEIVLPVIGNCYDHRHDEVYRDPYHFAQNLCFTILELIDDCAGTLYITRRDKVKVTVEGAAAEDSAVIVLEELVEEDEEDMDEECYHRGEEDGWRAVIRRGEQVE